MIRARFSRSASASCAMARCIEAGISTFFISTAWISTPCGLGRLIDALLEHQRELLTVLEHVVERVLADQIAQRGERDLDDGVAHVLHLDVIG